MDKSVYSLVLTDQVVRRVDAAAARAGLSRSAMVDRLLAEALSCTTPEMRMRSIFDQAQQLLCGDGVFQALLQPSDSMMSLRSALQYKYNPNVRFSVELFRGSGPARGEIRVSLRSQSSALILYLGQFYRLWAYAEERCGASPVFTVEDGKYTRRFTLPEGLDDNAQAELLAAYLSALKAGMTAFFADLDAPRTGEARVLEACRDYYRHYPAL